MPLTVRSAARAMMALAVTSVLVPARHASARQADTALSRASDRVTPALPAPVPFTVGEELVYRATFGGFRAGTARMRVDCIDTLRGRPAYHVVFIIDGGIPGFRMKDRYDSWIDVETLSSLRHIQEISEGPYKRHTTYEIYPERLQ